MKLRKLKVVVALLSLTAMTVCLTACGSGKSAAVTAYEKDLLSFKSSIDDIGAKINAIDASAADATNELLYYVDYINKDFQALLTLSVPEGYESITRLNEKAASYMESATSYFHTAYEANPFDSEAYNTANTYYAKAFEMVNYTGQVLQGAEISFATDDN